MISKINQRSTDNHKAKPNHLFGSEIVNNFCFEFNIVVGVKDEPDVELWFEEVVLSIYTLIKLRQK